VLEAFQEEKPQLLSLPDHPFQADSPIPVHSRKTIYVRFDRNDYSIPPEAVGPALTLVASDTLVRILDGSLVVASHRRSYDRGQVVADPAHQQALLQQKRKAWAAAPSDRLTAAAPRAEAFLEAALQKGESLSQQTRQLLLLLEEYGAEALREALDQALQRETPRASSVAFLLQSGRRNDGSPRPVDLSRRPELAALDVSPHSPEDYDALAKPDSDPESDPE
jgi:hypothetical protein